MLQILLLYSNNFTNNFDDFLTDNNTFYIDHNMEALNYSMTYDKVPAI